MASIKAVYEKPLKTLDSLGEELAFYIKALGWTPRTVRRYKKEIMRILAEVTLGSGALAVIGGTVGVITAMCFFTGTEVGLQGYAALNQIGTAAFPASTPPTSTPARSRRWSPRSPWPPPSAAASPPSSARCGSPRRSTRSR